MNQLQATTGARRPLWLALSLGLGLSIICLACRPALVIDETRYLTVAWEMQVSGDYLVPHLNGEIYSHKPPLLFWLMNIAWQLTGNSELAARMVAPLAGLATLGLTFGLARRLWPAEPRIADYSPLLLVAMVLWSIFSTLTMFDTLIAFATVVAFHGVLMVTQGRQLGGWLLCGFGVGLGLLAKGPVIFVHTLPVLLFGPVWWPSTSTQGDSPAVVMTLSRGRWYAGVGLAMLIGIVVVGCWVLPAIIAGGAEYRDAILWKQSAGRMVNSFAHRQPFWWYLPFMPLFALPWTLWGTFWKSLRKVTVDSGTKFCLIWGIGSILLLSLISGKQAHYVMPMLPALAMLIARVVATSDLSPRREVAWMGWGTLLAAAFMLSCRWLPLPDILPLGEAMTPWYGLVIAVSGVAILWSTQRSIAHTVSTVATCAVINCAVIHLSLANGYFSTCEIKPLADQIARLQQEGKPIAHHGDYAGQFQFAGRIREPLEVLVTAEEIADWQQRHPDGYIVGYQWSGKPSRWETKIDQQVYRRGMSTHMAGLVPSSIHFVPPSDRTKTSSPAGHASPNPMTASHTAPPTVVTH